MPARQLPARPHLQQLRHQARELLRRAHTGDESALADFLEYHPERVDAHTAILADAQLVLARSYEIASWPRLVATCALLNALAADDFGELHELATAHPELLASNAAHASVRVAASAGLRRAIDTLQSRGARGIDAVQHSPELSSWIDTLRLLGRVGARFPSDAVGGAVESLAGSNFAFMIETGTPVEDERGEWQSRVALALETYARNPQGKHTILATMAAHGVPLPATPPMALHCGRIDLLEAWLERDPFLLQRTFAHEEIFPPQLGCHANHALALVGAPLNGATLLHMAAEYEELAIAGWLLDHGAPADVRAAVSDDGFGGHTALFHCVVTYNAGRRDDRIARLLLSRGANVRARASLRHSLPFAADTTVHEYRDVTPLEWGQQFHDQSYVSQSAMRLIAELVDPECGER